MQIRASSRVPQGAANLVPLGAKVNIPRDEPVSDGMEIPGTGCSGAPGGVLAPNSVRDSVSRVVSNVLPSGVRPTAPPNPSSSFCGTPPDAVTVQSCRELVR